MQKFQNEHKLCYFFIISAVVYFTVYYMLFYINILQKSQTNFRERSAVNSANFQTLYFICVPIKNLLMNEYHAILMYIQSVLRFRELLE